MDLKEFNDLIDLGRVTRTVKVAGRDIRMHTLDSSEYAKMTERLGDDNISMGRRLESLQREVLASAIDSIDEKSISLEDKSKLVGQFQVGFSNLLYDEYGKMVEEQAKILEESKKNSAQTMTGSPT